jgi:hypothetical protein
VSAPTTFDGARLATQTWLTLPEAAFYLGYTTERMKDPHKAFHAFVVRHGIKRGYLGRALRFRRAMLDQLVSGEPTCGQWAGDLKLEVRSSKDEKTARDVASVDGPGGHQ